MRKPLQYTASFTNLNLSINKKWPNIRRCFWETRWWHHFRWSDPPKISELVWNWKIQSPVTPTQKVKFFRRYLKATRRRAYLPTPLWNGVKQLSNNLRFTNITWFCFHAWLFNFPGHEVALVQLIWRQQLSRQLEWKAIFNFCTLLIFPLLIKLRL